VIDEFTLTQPLPSRERSYLAIPLPWLEGRGEEEKFAQIGDEKAGRLDRCIILL
jgi:hypothetical protein